MAIKYEDIKAANDTLKSIDVKGKNYVEVNQRIKAFRMLYPAGSIQTEILSNMNGVVLMKASIIDDQGVLLGTGHAYEKETSSYINKTSYIENCETSAVGRALAMCGIGIDTSVASAEEVENAINNQYENKEIRFKTYKRIFDDYFTQFPEDKAKTLKKYGITSIDDLDKKLDPKKLDALLTRVKKKLNEHPANLDINRVIDTF